MTPEGILRILSLRKKDLQDKIDYLRDPKVNPPSRHEGETINEYANGKICACEEEIEFIDRIFNLTKAMEEYADLQNQELKKECEYLLGIVRMAKETGELWLNNQDWDKIEGFR